MSDEIASRLELARKIALEAGEVTLRYFRRADLQVDTKHDASPVTIADREAEQHLRRAIALAFPHDAILGEEFGEQRGTSGYRWILDPIDGTQSFIHGVPLYGTLIGVEKDERSQLGVIHVPALGETAWGSVGGGAWTQVRGGEVCAAKVSSTARLDEAIFLTSDFAGYVKSQREDVLARLGRAFRRGRTWGDCYGYLLVATGRADVMVDPIMNVWDAAALQPILEEAGGTYTDWKGTPTIHGGEGIATNGRLLPAVLELVQGRPHSGATA